MSNWLSPNPPHISIPLPIIKMEKLTVHKAIEKGHRMVNYPLFPIMIIGFGITGYLSVVLENVWIFPIGFVLTFLLMWLWWSFQITKWRIWAFENCRNVHELKRRAINQKLIWPDGSRFEKTEIRTKNQKDKLKTIKRKFDKEDEIEIIEDDKSVPTETKIYYSKLALAIYWVMGLGLFLYGFYLAIEVGIYGYFLVACSSFLIYTANKKSKITEPYIIINSKGIKTLNTAFTAWENIKTIETELRGSGKQSKWHLEVEFKNKNSSGEFGDNIEINDLSKSPKKIQKLIKLYQQRNRMKNYR